ncbi:MAG: alpha/beta hydrolase, partial [Planctomycetota bacterium]
SGAIPYPSVPKGEDNKRVAFAIIHGTADQAVPVADSRRAEKLLKEAGYKWVKYWELPGHAHSVDRKTVDKAHNWLLEVFKKGGGGGEAPWSKEEVEKKMNKVKSLAGEKKFSEAEAVLKGLEKKGRYMTGKTGKIVVDALKPLAESSDRATKLFAIKSLGYGESAATSILKKTLSAAEKENDEELYLVAITGLAKAGEKALSTLHSVIKKNLFGFKAAKAAVEAVERIKSPKSAKPLVSLLASIEKEGGEKKNALFEAVQKSLRTITGAQCSTAEEWKQWLKDNKFR